MNTHLCATCGTQFPPSELPPSRCSICEDERQYVGWEGQRWTTPEEVAREHTLRIEEDAGLLALDTQPAFAIAQRSFLLPTDAGNLLWEAQSLVTEEAVARIEAAGGLDRILVSHPHFYGAMVEWSEALGGVPILLHEADHAWIQRPHPSIESWTGDRLSLSGEVTLVRCGGHFEGSTALHWSGGPRRGGALFAGDALQVSLDRRSVSFLYSYPNLLPMPTSEVIALRERLSTLEYEDVLGYSRGRNILGGGREAVEASFDRYLEAVRS